MSSLKRLNRILKNCVSIVKYKLIKSKILMHKKYQLIISQSDPYPFNQINEDFSQFEYQVKIKIFIENNKWETFQKKIRKILDLQKNLTSLIKVNSISQDRIRSCAIPVYQYVEYSLFQFLQLKLQISFVELKICQLCQFLIQHKILPIYSIKNFGFNKNKELKYILLPNFSSLSDQNLLQNQTHKVYSNVKNMLKSMKSSFSLSPRDTLEDDKISQRKSQRDLSEYNKKFEQKISSIENRLLLNRNGISDKINHQKIKRRKKFSQNFTEQSYSGSSSSENSYRVIENNQPKVNILKQKKKSLNEDHRYSYSKTQTDKFYNKSCQNVGSQQNNSNQQKQSPQSPQKQKESKLSNSMIMHQNNEENQRLKHHKSSFGDYSNYGNQSEKQVKLKRRITCALEKSQYALKIYEKYQIKRGNFLAIAENV